LVGKRSVLKTCNELPYKVYNSVPVVLYLKPFRTTGCTDRKRKSDVRDVSGNVCGRGVPC
jgi:hypothetical protein